MKRTIVLLSVRALRLCVTLAVLLASVAPLFTPGATQLAYAAANDISGTIYEDFEGNASVLDAFDYPLSGIHVYLYRDNGDNTPNTGDSLIAETLTNASGGYAFLNQPNGTFWIVAESGDINNLGASVEQTYGGTGALIDADANSATPATPRPDAGPAYGGRRMLEADGFTSETRLLDEAEHIIRVVLDGSGTGHTEKDFGFSLYKGLAGGYSEYFIPTQITETGVSETVSGAFGAMTGGIWSILKDLDNDTAISGGMHYIIAVGAVTDVTTIYYDHWEDGYDFDAQNPVATSDQTVVLNSGQVQIFESSAVPVNPRGTATYYDGRDRVLIAGGPAVVTVSLFPENPGSVYNIAFEILPVKPLQTSYIVPVGEGMSGNGQYDFEQTFLSIQSATDGNTITVDDPSEPGVPDLTVILDQGEVLDVRHTAPGTVVTGSSRIQVQMISGYYQAGGASEADGITIFPDTLWDNEYYNPVESAGDAANDGGNASLYATELYLYNPNSSAITIQYEDSTGSGAYNLGAYSTAAYSQMAGRYVPVGSAAYLKSANNEKFWAIGQGGVSTTSINAGTASAGGGVHTYFDSGFSLVPGYLLRQDYYLAWAPGDSTTQITNASAVYITAVADNTEVFIDFDNDGNADQTDFDNADGDNNPATGMEYSTILDRLESIQLRDPNSPYTMSGAHVWSNGATAAIWAPYPRTASYISPSLDAGYTSMPLPLEWMDGVLGILKSVDNPNHRPVVDETATFTLAVPVFQAVNDLVVTDILPLGWNYDNGTSTITVYKDGVTSSTASDPATSGDGTATRQVLTWNLNSLLGDGLDDLDPNDYLVISFTAISNASVQAGYNQNDTEVCGTRLGGIQTFCAVDDLAVYVTPLLIDMDTTTPVVAPGGQATYTVHLINIDPNSDLTSVNLTNSLPAGFSYVGGSAVYQVIDNNDAGDTVPGDGVNPSTQPSNGNTNLTWGNWTLGNGDELIITFNVTVSNVAGVYDNTVSASSTLALVTYYVTDVGPSGYDLGTPTNADPEEDEDVTVGLSLSGTAWLDDGAGGGITNNGVREIGETGQPGMVVYLYDSSGQNVLQTVLTDANGDYTFSGLAGNTTYIVEFGTPPAGYDVALQDIGDDASDSDVDPATRRVSVPLTTVPVNDVDAGFAPFASIGDRIWLDLNGDGAQDASEPGISGVSVFVDLNNNGVYDAGFDVLDTTDANGLYTFENLAAGTYRIIVVPPSGSTQTGDPDSTFNHEHTITVSAPGVYLDVDFGYLGTGSIADKVWNDLDGDGLQDAGEGGISGVSVWIDLDGDSVWDESEPGDVTDANGLYVIEGLIAGSYTVRTAGSVLSGATRTYDLDGTGTADMTVVVLAAGETRTDVDWGYQYPVLSISKTSSMPGAVGPGNMITYTIIVRNNTASSHTGLVINDPLPDGTRYVDETTVVNGYQPGASLTYRDEFGTQAYNNTNGTATWTTSWVEAGADSAGSASAGTTLITGGRLRFDGSAALSTLTRAADLTTVATATLTFDYFRNDTIEAGDLFEVQISSNGGTNWTTLDSYNGTLAASGSYSRDISAYATANTQIRLAVTGFTNGTERAEVDNLQIAFTPIVSVTLDNNPLSPDNALNSGIPGTLVQLADGFVLASGQEMQVTFTVEVITNPGALTHVNNTASVISTQQPTPRYASASNIRQTTPTAVNLVQFGAHPAQPYAWMAGAAVLLALLGLVLAGKLRNR